MSSYKLYNYDPSQSAATAFAIMFAFTAAGHVFQLFWNRAWFFIPFLIGSIFEIIGYIARVASAKQTPNWTTMPYVIQELFLLLAPSFFAASIYMILGRIIRLLHAESNSLIRTTWLTKIFVTGDVVSFLMQSGGGGILATAKTESSLNLGNYIIVAGLIVQVISFTIFITVSIVFHRRMLSTPLHHLVQSKVPWTRYMKVLYIGSALILVRSAYRVVEYIQGSSGYLQSKECFVYIFDATLMLLCCLLFNAFHPSKLLSKSSSVDEREDLEMMNQDGYKSFGGRT
ncbi:hypothetical protein N7493_000400 [Penicillium malachiteum]|uniref:RTA-like protein n=1 Tax=Penicillium malachiteum TaxID=1324776 RepID=A0AAD6HW86_9EURO|nr:hypothetical protein N7493_000400 [Penicillium malachiteum]